MISMTQALQAVAQLGISKRTAEANPTVFVAAVREIGEQAQKKVEAAQLAQPGAFNPPHLGSKVDLFA